MPIFVDACPNEQCPQYRVKVEWYAHTADRPDPLCESCGTQMRRCVANFAVIWTKSLAEYGDPHKETYHKDLKSEGQVVAHKRSRGGTPEKPVFRRIDSVAEQRRFCREEGLVPPTDIGNVRIDKSGTQIHSNAGEPGVWV